MNIAELVQEYRRIRDQLDSKRTAYNTFESGAKDAMEKLELEMLAISNQTGVDSFKTPYGTVFKTTKSYARLSEGEIGRELRDAYALETKDFGLYTAHVNKAHAVELMEEGINLEEIGIVYQTEYVMQFRK